MVNYARRGFGPAILLAALTLNGCGGDESGAAAAGSPAQQKAGGPGGADATPPVAVAVTPAFRGSIATYHSATATLEAEKEAEILARVSGIVRSIEAEEGDAVREGADLLRIEDREYRLREDQARAAVTNQKSRHDRLEGMFRENLVSAEEFDTVKNELGSAEAELGLAELNLSYTRVVAPFSGRVVTRLVDPGQNVSPGTPLFRLADFEPLLARVHVPSKEFRKLQAEQPVELVLDSNQKRLGGRITLVSPVIDPQTGTIKLTLEIPEYPEDTRPGDFAQVRIVTEERTGALLVPRVAVVAEKGEQVVFVVVDGLAERRVVRLGFQDDRNAEILDGVAESEPVVVRGQRSLKHGSPVKLLEDTLSADTPEASES
jgi:membrane fusion protein (multidrug efflux system)